MPKTEKEKKESENLWMQTRILYTFECKDKYKGDFE